MVEWIFYGRYSEDSNSVKKISWMYFKDVHRAVQSNDFYKLGALRWTDDWQEVALGLFFNIAKHLLRPCFRGSCHHILRKEYFHLAL